MNIGVGNGDMGSISGLDFSGLRGGRRGGRRGRGSSRGRGSFNLGVDNDYMGDIYDIDFRRLDEETETAPLETEPLSIVADTETEARRRWDNMNIGVGNGDMGSISGLDFSGLRGGRRGGRRGRGSSRGRGSFNLGVDNDYMGDIYDIDFRRLDEETE